MATPSEKLAEALSELQKLQKDRNVAVIKASDLKTTYKQLLKANGFIKDVIKGWYISTSPDEKKGDTTSWFMSFWDFASIYLNERFEEGWCLSPDQSLLLHCGNRIIPKQLLVRSPKANNNIVQLLHGTSILDYKLDIPANDSRVNLNGLQVYSIESGLIAVGTDFYSRHAIDARTCLAMVRDASLLLEKLLEGGHSVIAGRLAGAFRNIGNDRISDNILKTMKSAGYFVREEDPFTDPLPEHILSVRDLLS